MYIVGNISKMMEFLIDNIVWFGACLFHQIIGISMGRNCAP